MAHLGGWLVSGPWEEKGSGQIRQAQRLQCGWELRRACGLYGLSTLSASETEEGCILSPWETWAVHLSFVFSHLIMSLKCSALEPACWTAGKELLLQHVCSFLRSVAAGKQSCTLPEGTTGGGQKVHSGFPVRWYESNPTQYLIQQLVSHFTYKKALCAIVLKYLLYIHHSQFPLSLFSVEAENS